MGNTLIIGNWKMYKTGAETLAYIKALLPHLGRTDQKVGLAPPFTSLAAAAHAAAGSPLMIGAQNMHDAAEGAYTGEISAQMLVSSGARFVILGHSERRQHFHESNAFIRRKIGRALEQKLLPILCIGETGAEREAGMTHEALRKQLEGITSSELVIAYEPIWAIGTGKTATPHMAQETHAYIRSLLPHKIPLLYGGSVKPDNISALLDQPDIDGALVGGASLDPHTFAQIINRTL